jgi:yecA family protein
MPSEYLPEVFGGEMSEACDFGSLDEANEVLGLMMRHWNDIAGTLLKDEPYVPLLLEEEAGAANGNDWARGFMRGIEMRHDGWAELVNDEDHGGCLIPMMMLYYEHDEDPEMRPEPISAETAGKDHRAHGGRAPRSVPAFQGAPGSRCRHRHGWAPAQHTQDRAERPLPVRLREEIQAVLRRRCGQLNACRPSGQGFPVRRRRTKGANLR